MRERIRKQVLGVFVPVAVVAAMAKSFLEGKAKAKVGEALMERGKPTPCIIPGALLSLSLPPPKWSHL